MSSPFFQQRSFEVVWAAFRVAQYVSRPVLKKGLEDKATNYLLNKTTDTILDLEDVVKLCAQINEITSVNAKVLLREINNLKSIVFDLQKDDSQTNLIIDPANSPDLESMFSKPPMLVGDIIKLREKTIPEEIKKGVIIATQEKKELAINKEEKLSESGNAPVAKKQENKLPDVIYVKSPATEMPNSTETKLESGNNNIQKSEVKVDISQESGKSPAIETKKLEESRPLISPERQDIIIKLLRTRSLCHIRDIVSALPGVSERTLRYDIQQLVNKRIIERVGSGGPNSFLRLKKSQNAR